MAIHRCAGRCRHDLDFVCDGYRRGRRRRPDDTEDNLGSGHPQPFAIEGVAIGKTAGGVLGHTTNSGSTGVYGLNSGSGFGGYFSLKGAAAIFGNSALGAVNSGGSKSVNGPYGNAGFFEISNHHNTDTALFVETFGNGTGFHAETHGAETASAAEGVGKVERGHRRRSSRKGNPRRSRSSPSRIAGSTGVSGSGTSRDAEPRRDGEVEQAIPCLAHAAAHKRHLSHGSLAGRRGEIPGRAAGLFADLTPTRSPPPCFRYP